MKKKLLYRLLVFSLLLFVGCGEAESVAFDDEGIENDLIAIEEVPDSAEIEPEESQSEEEESEVADENILGYTEAGREMCKERSTRIKVYSAFSDAYIDNGGERFSIYLTNQEEIAVKEIIERNRDALVEDVGQWESMIDVSFSWNLVPEPDASSEDYYDQVAQLNIYTTNRKVELCGMGAIAWHGELPEEDWQTLIHIAKACYEGTEASIVAE